MFRNVSYLFVAQLIGMLVPILEVPLLAKSLGPSQYGTLVFVQSLALLFSILVEYGFNLTGTRDVAKKRDDVGQTKRILADVYSAKIILSLGVLMVGVLLPFFYPNIKIYYWVFGLFYFLAFGFSTFWFFQGLEKIGADVAVELALRLTSLLFLYLFVSESDDIVWTCSIMSSFAALNTVTGIILAGRMVGYGALSFRRGLKRIKQGFDLFIYKSANSILLNSGPVLVGFTAGQSSVGAYALAEKFVRAIAGFIVPFLTAVFPFFAVRIDENNQKALALSWLVAVVAFVLGCISSIFLFLFAPHIVELFLGQEYAGSEDFLRVFCLIIPFRLFNQAAGLLVFVSLKKDRLLGRLVIMSTILAVCAAVLLSLSLGGIGVIYGFVIAEFFLFVALLRFGSKFLGFGSWGKKC